MSTIQMPEPKRKISDILTDVKEVVQDSPPTKRKEQPDIQKEELVQVSWRSRKSTVRAFKLYAAQREAAGMEPSRHQDLLDAALQEYMDRHPVKKD